MNEAEGLNIEKIIAEFPVGKSLADGYIVYEFTPNTIRVAKAKSIEEVTDNTEVKEVDLADLLAMKN